MAEVGVRIKLHTLKNLPGATKQAIRVGRGRSSRRGKTAGRGHKGYGQHNGTVRLGFEGGQTPFYRRQPKHGFKNPFSVEYQTINLSKLKDFIARGKIDASQPIDMHTLWKSGAIDKIQNGVKLLGEGSADFDLPVRIEVSRASKSAIEAIEKAGGIVSCAYYDRVGLRALLKPEKFTTIPRRARPPNKQRPYYENPENRGYLAGFESHEEAVLHRFQVLNLGKPTETAATPSSTDQDVPAR